MASVIQIQGAVVDIISRVNDSRNPKVFFKLKTSEGKDYKVECPFFCPLSNGDGFYGVAQVLDSQNLKILKPPFVSVPVDKDNTLQFFLRTLRGTKFGAVSATRFYEELENLAREFQYGKQFESELASDESSTKSYNAITPESRYFGDGVVAFLTEYSAEFCNNKNEKVINMIAGKTLNKPQVKKLLEEWHNKRSFRRLFLLGLTRGEILSSGKNLEDLYNICLENPYKIASIQYDKCEKILNSIGKIPTDIQKDCGRINRYIYENVNSKGWFCTPEWMVRRAFPKYDTYKDILLKEYDMTEVNEKVYLTYNYKIETRVANYVNSLISDTVKEYEKKDLFSLSSSLYECKTLTDEQKNAINGALRSKISVITGGAGVGKSLCIREITRNLSIRGVNYYVCAFTGKAVSRIHEIMKNKNAMTIDRLIMKIKERTSNDPKFEKESIKHIIVDESSMVTTELFYRLISQLNTKVAFTFLGDCNQLPPIGAGTLMKELMHSFRVPIFYLTQNQRIIPHTSIKDTTEASPGSKEFERYILENANALIDSKRSKRHPLKYKEGEGFYILEGNKETVHTIIDSLKKVNIDKDKIVIISPYKAPLQELNNIFQQVFFGEIMTPENSYHQPTPSGGRLWCIGDRVMMNVNNYKINVMNGEQGNVVGIEDSGIRVEFEGEVQHLFKFSSGLDPEKDELEDIDENSSSNELFVDHLSHSFAISCHKSQGSEYEYVILYIPEDKAFSNFLNINLLYTAITRTKRTIWIVGSRSTLEKISMTDMPPRYDGLSSMLRSMQVSESEKVLETLVLKPEIATGSHLSTTLTSFAEKEDSYDDILALYDDDDFI